MERKIKEEEKKRLTSNIITPKPTKNPTRNTVISTRKKGKDNKPEISSQ